jgi:3D (Asp-Asp-Asp) domain-containing protein
MKRKLNRQQIQQNRRIAFAFLALIAFAAFLIGIFSSIEKDDSAPAKVRSAAMLTSQAVLSAQPELNLSQPSKYQATAYGPPWDAINGTGITYTGLPLNGPACVVAVDPEQIPLYSRITIFPNPHQQCKVYQALDIGGAIKGKRIDIYDWRGRESQYSWGLKEVQVRIVKPESK